ncbi:MAG: flagellar motor switch protein FliN [Fimbriimonadaceae bacterium]|nr:flagellar motor switch protein FliN [Fimbriimonadaceae bacterium]MCE2768112.1 flagellar motor switch protein FliN [Fimbriimonadaceae bacterium]
MNNLQLLQRIGELLPAIWDTVSDTVSNNSTEPVRFESPIAMRATSQDVIAELGGNMLMIQFAMASNPDGMQVILIRPDLVLDIAKVLTGLTFDEVDENVLVDIRPFAEAIVQGLCIGLGNALFDTVVATGMGVRFQMLQLPDNLVSSPSIVRTQVAISMENVSGVCVWLMDDVTAAVIGGMNLDDEDEEEEFGFDALDTQNKSTKSGSKDKRADATSGMEVLLDVPLEISVELGRVKMMVREVLDLGTGSIIEVDKAAGEPVDVMVNGRLVAKGEVVVIEDNFGVRVTEILNPAERFRMDAA